MRTIKLILAITAIIAPATVQAAEQATCLTAGEFAAVARYGLPSAIAGTAQRCGPSLGANAFLTKNGAQLAARYAVDKDKSWPTTRAALSRLGGATGNQDAALLFKTLPDENLRPLVDTMITGMVAQRLPQERCATVDRLIGLLAPLPPESTAEIIAIAAGLGAASGKAKVGSLSLCPPV